MSDLILSLMIFAGVGIALWGFFWMSKYEKRPTGDDSKKWIEKYKKKHGNWDPKLTDLVRGELDLGKVYDFDDVAAPKKFIEQWKKRRKIGRIMVPIGILIPAIEIIFSIVTT